MAFLNDARQLAEQATRSIEQGLDQVRERIDELQRQRRFNELGRQLGMLVYRSRRAATPLDEGEVERICAEMASIEATPDGAGGATGGATTGPGTPATGPGAPATPGAPGTPGGPDAPGTSGGPGAPGSPHGDPPAPSGGYSLDDLSP